MGMVGYIQCVWVYVGVYVGVCVYVCVSVCGCVCVFVYVCVLMVFRFYANVLNIKNTLDYKNSDILECYFCGQLAMLCV